MDEKEKTEVSEGKASESGENKDFVFIREEMKNRPVNKGKLARSTLISAVSAVVFGLVACVTFAFILPIVTGYIGKDDETVEATPERVVFPEETEDEEMNPEDMLQTNEPEVIIEEVPGHVEESEIQDIVDKMDLDFTLDDYQEIYGDLSEIATEAERAVVKVRTITTDTDWFDNLLEETTTVPGLIVADNDANLFILAASKNIDTSEDIYVTFDNEISVKAVCQAEDPYTGLSILAVPDVNINEATRETFKVASLGGSNASKLSGALVIAIGNPMGTYGSVNYGMITSYGTRLYITDNTYKKITTDIYGSSYAEGILINLNGDVIGIINPDYADEGTPNLITAIGISELKKTIENMINGIDLVYFGVSGMDVPTQAVNEYSAPKGAFIMSVEMDSPAMLGGIQAGDIVTGIGDRSIGSANELVSAIRDLTPGTETTVNIMRQSQGTYKELTLMVIPEKLN